MTFLERVNSPADLRLLDGEDVGHAHRAHHARLHEIALVLHAKGLAIAGLGLEECGRLLLVETSGKLSFERTRRFYAGLGYRREAVIRDYYAAGDDKIVFAKPLT